MTTDNPAKIGYGAKAVDLSQWRRVTVTPGEDARVGRGYNTQAYQFIRIAQQCPIVDVCARWNATAMADQTLRLYRKVRGLGNVSGRRASYLRSGAAGSKIAEYLTDADEIREVTTHPALDVIGASDEHHSARELWIQRFWYMWVTGVAYDALVDVGGRLALMPLMPQHTIPLPDDDEFVRAYAYGRSGSNWVEIPASDVVAYRFMPHPTDPYGGYSPLWSAQQHAEVLIASMQIDRETLESGNIPPGILQLEDGISVDQAAAANRQLNQETYGISGKARLAMMTGIKGAIFPPSSAKENQSIEKVKELTLYIAQAYGVPESMLRLNDANLASAKTGYSVQYLDATIRPSINTIAAVLTEGLLPRLGFEPGELFFAFDDPTPSNEEQTTTLAVQQLAAGIITRGEARQALGLDDLPEPAAAVPVADDAAQPAGDPERPAGLDSPQMSELVNLVVLATSGDIPVQSAIAIAITAFPGINPQQIEAIFANVRPRTPDNGEDVRTEADNGGEGDGQPAQDGAADPAAAAVPDQRGWGAVAERFGKRFVAGVVDPYEPCECCGGLKAEVPAFESDEDVAAILRRLARPISAYLAASTEAAAEAVEGGRAFDTSAIRAQLAGEIREDVARLLILGGNVADAEMGVQEPAFDVQSETVQEAIQTYTIELADDLDETTVARVQSAVQRGLEEGSSPQALAQAIRDTGVDSDARAETIARTESSRIVNTGTRQRYLDLGVERLRWVNAPGATLVHQELARRFAEGNPIGEPFIRAGETVRVGDESETFRRDVFAPPARPNCRCSIFPVRQT